VLSAAGLRVIAPDLIGFGRSDKPADKAIHTYAFHVEAMTKLVTTLDVREATFFGQDWGGLIGLRVVAENPERFAAVVISNTGLPIGSGTVSPAFDNWKRANEAMNARGDMPIGAIVAQSVGDPALARAYDAPFPNPRYKAGPLIMPQRVPMTLEDPARAANLAAWEVFRKWQKPFVTAFGDGDPITRGGDRPFQEQVPGAKGQSHRTIAGAGHFIQETHGEELARIIIDLGKKSPAARFEAAPCPFTADAKVLDQVRCGSVTVLENRSAPDGRRLRLAVAIVKSLNPTPRPDPVVFIAGGPGNAPIERVPRFVMSGWLDALRADRDVIVYDQRGTGFSEPKFCPELSAEWNPRQYQGPAARRTHQQQMLARCGESMRRTGFDLAQYNSTVSAHDLQDLRRALGYEQWNLFARSYGTRLALVAMRVAPQGIRGAVFDGPSPPNRAVWFNRPGDFVDVLQRLSAACAAQPACNAAFPNVEQTFWRTVEELDREPRARQVPRPNGIPNTVMMTGAVVAARVVTGVHGPTSYQPCRC
jgi:haloalkane dehalogenase